MRDTDLAISFFTSLTLLANATTLGVVALALGSRLGIALAHRPWAWLQAQLSARGDLTLAWLVAMVATSGSLYFSEVAGYVPCRLCWYQRASMYPLVIVLGVAILGRGRWPWLRGVAVGLAGLGAVVATYHVFVERFPSLESGTCDPRVPCSLVWFERLGFVTLPFMALSGFLLILTLLLAIHLSPFPSPVPKENLA